MIPTAMVDLEENHFMQMLTTNFVLRLQNRFVFVAIQLLCSHCSIG